MTANGFSQSWQAASTCRVFNRKVQKNWQNVLPVVNKVALRLQGKRA